MRCCYLSDLHLETQEFSWKLPGGDVLIVAGDLCHASCLDAARTDLYAVRQRDRVLKFMDAARAGFPHVLLVAGNHDHYDGLFEETADTFRRCLPGATVLDDSSVEVGGIRFFGTTLWSDFERGRAEAMEKARRGVGEYFFVRTRARAGGVGRGARLQPDDTLAAHRRALSALAAALSDGQSRPMIVISHHAPSLQGLDLRHRGNGLDGAFASDLEGFIAAQERVPVWVHGHTHTRRTYRVGNTRVLVNCRGFEGRDESARSFTPNTFFDV